METTVNLLEKKLKGYSVAQLKSKLQRGCPELDKEICIAILKKRGENTSQWEVTEEKEQVFVNEDVKLTEEEIEIVEKAEMAFEKEKPSLSKLKDILKDEKKIVVKERKVKDKKVSDEKTGSHIESVEMEGLKVGDDVKLSDGSLGSIMKMFYSHKNGKEICKVKKSDGSFIHKMTSKLELKK
jgi:transcriptional regulator of heat shock response